LPFYYALYRKFATGDRFFCSLLSQTFPNRFYLLAGTSFGHIRNDFPGPTEFAQPTIFNRLDDAGVAWKVYSSQFPFANLFDHVPPPSACVPDAIPPMLEPGDEPGAFDRYGIRVPVVVVSPYARRRFVSHEAHDHTSILRFIATRFDLPALTARDANADPMLE